jgi:hypothetical protein
MGGFGRKCRFRFSKALLPATQPPLATPVWAMPKRHSRRGGTEGLCKGGTIKVTDSLQESMCIASAVGKEDTRAFVARRLQA